MATHARKAIDRSCAVCGAVQARPYHTDHAHFLCAQCLRDAVAARDLRARQIDAAKAVEKRVMGGESFDSALEKVRAELGV